MASRCIQIYQDASRSIKMYPDVSRCIQLSPRSLCWCYWFGSGSTAPLGSLRLLRSGAAMVATVPRAAPQHLAVMCFWNHQRILQACGSTPFGEPINQRIHQWLHQEWDLPRPSRSVTPPKRFPNDGKVARDGMGFLSKSFPILENSAC